LKTQVSYSMAPSSIDQMASRCFRLLIWTDEPKLEERASSWLGGFSPPADATILGLSWS